MASMCKLRLELIYKHDRKSVWELWVTIEGSHILQGASIRNAAWTLLLGMCKVADEGYTEYLTRVTHARYRIDHIMPSRVVRFSRSGFI